MVMGEGRNRISNIFNALGKEHNLKNAPDILARVQRAIARWRAHADTVGVSAKSEDGFRVTLKGSFSALGRA